MNGLEGDVLAAMRQRRSVRSYQDLPVEPTLCEHLLALSKAVDHLTNFPPRIALISGSEQTQHVLTYMIGSYGLVLNAPHLLVGIVPEENDASLLDLGYVLEQVVLRATQLGLGTCWITGSYDARRAGNSVGLEPGEKAVAVCALGHPAQDRWGRLHSRIVRRVAAGHRRKPLRDVVFSGQWGEPWFPGDADSTLATILTHACLAPSARNRQPWRFIVMSDRVVLATVQPAPIDGGIVMAHLTLAFAALKGGGRWEVRLGDDELRQTCGLPQDVTYVAAFIPARPMMRPSGEKETGG
jgi:nitroreductase